MSVLKLDGVANDLKPLIGKLLGDASVPTRLVSASPGSSVTASAGEVSLVFGASIGLAIDLLNDESDLDDDGLLHMGQGGSAGLLRFDRRSAWLKYSLSANVTAAASAKIGTAGGGISGDRDMRLLYYKRHSRTDDILGSIGSDAQEVPSALTVADISGIGTGDIVSVATSGTLKASLEVAWADVFSVAGGAIGRLARTLGATNSVLEVQLGAKATFDIEVTDAFSLSVARIDTDRFCVTVGTSDSVERHAGFTFGVTAGLSAKSAAAVVGTLKSGLLGLPTQALQQIESATALDSLPDAIGKLVATLMERLHFRGQAFADLKKWLKDLDNDCTSTLKAVAEAKIAAAFAYSYRRKGSRSSLVQGAVDGATLNRLHPGLLLFDVSGFLGDPGVTLLSTMFTQATSISRAWSFTLGFGDWLNIGSAERVDAGLMERTAATPAGTRHTVSFAGSIHNTDSMWTDHEIEYGLLLEGDSDFTSAAGTPHAWRSGGAFALWWADSKLDVSNAKDRARLLDDARVFGLISGDRTAELEARLGKIPDNTRGVRFDMAFSEDGMRRTVASMAAAAHDDWARFAARALPWEADSELRGSPEAREQTFAPFFLAYGRSPQVDVGLLPGMARNLLRDHGKMGDWMWNILARSDMNGGRFWPRWDELGEGSRHFASILQGTATDWGTFAAVFHKRFVVGKQVHLVRTLAGFLAERSGPNMHEDTACSLTLTVGAADHANVRIIIG